MIGVVGFDLKKAPEGAFLLEYSLNYFITIRCSFILSKTVLTADRS